MTTQPNWKLVANLGDVSPLEYGGLFVYEDTTGVYPPEAEKLIVHYSGREDHWTVYRFILEPCTYSNGVLSANKFHPDHAAWFAKDLERVANTFGLHEEELRDLFLSEEIAERAQAWDMVGEYYGFENLDGYPLHYSTRAEIESAYPEHA